MQGTPVGLSLDRLIRAVWIATAAVYGLGLLHLYLVHWHGMDPYGSLRVFNLDAEDVIPSWYSSILLASSALASLLVGLSESRDSDTRVFWLGLAGLMAFLSMDEGASLHEQSANLAGRLGVAPDSFEAPGFRWLLFGVPAVIVVGLLCLPMLRRLDRRTAGLFVLSGGFFVLGAAGMEWLGSHAWAVSDGTSASAGGFVALEEGFEFLGSTLFLATVLGCLARRRPAFQLSLRSDPGHDAAGLRPDRQPGRP